MEVFGQKVNKTTVLAWRAPVLGENRGRSTALIRSMAFGLAFAALAACSPPAAITDTGTAPGEAAAQTASGAPAGADETVNAWNREQFTTSLIEPVTITYGDFNGDGAADALAWGYFATGGSSGDTSITLWRNENGRMVFVRSPDDVYGQEPRNIQIARGRITLTTSVPRPHDPRCCPTGEQDWTISTN